MMSKQAVEIFIAYARRDSAYLEELRTHFAPLVRSGRVRIWYDGEIQPGTVWEAAIKEHLHQADIILLLLSADAIASDYFYEKEVADALQRHEQGEARVVPFILRACAWKATALAELQAIPKDGKPVTAWKERDDAYADAVESLWHIVAQIEQERSEQAAAAAREKAAQLAAQREAERRREEEARRRREAEAEAQRAEQERLRREAEAQQRRLDEERRQKEAAEQNALLARQAEYARHIAEAQKRLRRRDWPRAKAAAEAALRLAPEDADARHLISLAEEGSRRPAPPKPPYLRWAGIAAGVLLAVFIIVKLASAPGKESEAEVAAREYAEAWRKAEAENTLPAWTDFLEIYPDGERQEAAQQRVASLETKLKALLNDAVVLLEIGDKTGACNDLRDALRIAPNEPDILQLVKKAGCPPPAQ
jgi:hypothetical protein